MPTSSNSGKNPKHRHQTPLSRQRGAESEGTRCSFLGRLRSVVRRDDASVSTVSLQNSPWPLPAPPTAIEAGLTLYDDSRLALVRKLIATVALLVLPAQFVAAEEAPLIRISIKADSPTIRTAGEQEIEGRVVAERGGSLLLIDRAGRLWPVTPDQLLRREETGESFAPFTQQEMVAQLRSELGEGFQFVTTRNYVLCTEAGVDYARWTGLLFERLLSAFTKIWDRKPLELTEPEFPLCAIILKNKSRFQEFAVKDAGPEVVDALGYYSTLTNRMVMYDLTEGLAGQPPRSPLEFNKRLLGQISNVSTIVHEATHQVAFNTGLHARLVDNPFWLVEGMAMYFETPDLSNAQGWRTIGALNTSRLKTFRDYYRSRRKPNALREMIGSDDRINNADTALETYSEAWALTYYLIKVRRDDYTRYLEAISQNRDNFTKETPADRIAEFEEHFGEMDEVETRMIKYLSAQIR